MRAALNPLRTLRGWCAEIRDAQLDQLAEFERLDAAVQQHMAQPAMWTADPLTDHLHLALQHQLANGGPVWPDEAGAPEGLRPPCASGAPLTARQWQALAATHAEGTGSAWWLAAGIATLAVVGALFHFYPMGWAA